MSTTMLKRDLGTGDLCDNIGLVGVPAKWSYVTASPSHHDQAIPILAPLLFMHVGIFDLLVHVYTYTYTCMYIYIQTRHTHHTITCIHAQCFIHIHHVTIHKIVTAPRDYALYMTYDNEACCFAHHAHRYHGWRGNSSRFLDLPVRMMKTSATCGCQAWTTQ